MKEIDGKWYVDGVDENDPNCIHTVEDMMDYIDEVGFLPLFSNEIEGFSVEEHTAKEQWWTDDARDPWAWREVIARSGRIVYGKFLDNKNGFISKKWFPDYANYKRDGYDFDALWDDGKAERRQKAIMDFYVDNNTAIYPSYELKEKAGFGKNGHKNFEGVLTALQMKSYLCMCDFKQRTNKKGESYGWAVAVYCMPEKLWGYDYVTSRYSDKPEVSKEKIAKQIMKYFPDADEKKLKKMLR